MLKQKLILSYSSKILQQVIQVVVTIVVARLAGATVFGTVNFALAYVSMFIPISDFGLGSAHMKMVSEGNDEAACNGTFLRLQAILIGIYVMLVMGVFLGQKYIFGYKFESPVHEQVIIITLIAVTLGRVQYIFKVFFMAKTEQAKQDIPELIEFMVYQALRLLVVLIGYKALALAFSKLVSVILITPVFFFLFKNYRVGKFDRKLVKPYFLISITVFMADIVDAFINYGDKVLLQFLSNSAEVGYYTAGFRIGGFIQLVGTTVGLLFFPTFSKSIAEKNYDRINGIIRKYEKFSLSFIFPVTIIISIFSEAIITLVLGKAYSKTIPIMSLVNISAFVLTFIIPYGNVLTGSGMFLLVMLINIADGIFYGIVAFFLVAPGFMNMSSVGLAISLVSAKIFLGCLFIYFVHLKVKDIKILPTRGLLIFGIVFSIASYFIYQALPMVLWIKFAFCFLYFAGYWGLAMLMGLMTRNDWSMAIDLFNLKKMKHYIRSEITDKNKNNNDAGKENINKIGNQDEGNRE